MDRSSSSSSENRRCGTGLSKDGNNSSVTESDVKQILSNLKAKSDRRRPYAESPDGAKRFGGLVWMIDSNISSAYIKTRRLSAS